MKLKVPRRPYLVLAGAVAVAAVAMGAYLYGEHQERDHAFHAVQAGVLYRSRQPDNLDRRDLDRREITQVVNLRPRSEAPKEFDNELAMCKEAGLAMINIAVPGDMPTLEQIEQFLRVVHNGRGATLVHCEQGRARTGIMCGAYRVVVQNWSPQQAYDDLASYFHDGAVARGPALKQRRLDCFAELARDRDQWRNRLGLAAGRPATATAPAAAP